MVASRRVVLVTGASKGIGKAIALKAASEGACVVVNYQSDKLGADAVVAAIGPERAMAVQANVGESSEASRLIKTAVARFGAIDVLVANAAALPQADIESMTEADFDLAFGVNVKGPCFLAQVRLLPTHVK
jgi:3-oxoacyl-[acyl-carrier protein] reductase